MSRKPNNKNPDNPKPLNFDHAEERGPSIAGPAPFIVRTVKRNDGPNIPLGTPIINYS